MFERIVSAWDFLLYVMLTMIMVPAALRWHWWRFGARAYLWSMLASTGVVAFRKIWLAGLAQHWTILFLMGGSFASTVLITFATRPADRETLVRFYSKVRPFGLWGPVRREAERRGLVPPKDPMPKWDIVNAFVACFFQFSLGVAVFYMFLKNWRALGVWLFLCLAAAAVLYFTWYRNLPSPEET
jgi:SSS family solute:Na+ symporter